MPDDYYVSQYSGEEIDALLGGAGAGTVRYDVAQTLNDAQKTQARANIAAAPDGFGLGTINRVVTDFDTVKLNGWYYGAAGTAHAPDSENSWSVCVTNLAHNSEICIQDAYALSNVNEYLHCRRLVYVNTVTQDNPWEWVNYPMRIGVEYRTTERYMGKSVYIRMEEFTALPNNTTLTVSNVGVPSGGTLYVDNIVDYRAEFYSNSTVYSIPYNDVVDVPECNGSRYGSGITYSLRTKVADYSNCAGRIWIKYTKQTDQ